MMTTTTVTAAEGLTARVFEAVRAAGWRVDEQLRVFNEAGEPVGGFDVPALAWFFGLLPPASA